ncbi:MAG: hypothetical protein Q8L46_01825 [candidate division WWE3 bacterium]|nr:hypothetical protein [candidate division WWE3 bacterium]
MLDPIETGLFLTVGAAVVGMFFRIEHRLTKVETTVTHIKEHMSGCQPSSEDVTK